MAAKNEEKNVAGKNNVIVIVLLVIIAALVAGIGIYYITSKNTNKNVSVSEESVKKVSYFDLGEYTLNLNGDEKGNKYLKITINLSYDGENKDLTNELTDQKPAIRGAALEFLQSKSSDDFTPSNKSNSEHNISNTKKELITELNKKISKGKIIDVYFQDLIIQ